MTMKKQSAKDKRDESKAMKKMYKDYPSKESRAGHSYNESRKHHAAEARGMRRAMRDK